MSDGSAQVGQGAPPPKSSSHVSGAPDPSSILPLSPKSSPVKSLDASTATTHSTSEPTLHPVLSENTIDNCEHHGGAASTEPPATGLPLGSSLSSSQSASSSSAIPLHAPVATKPRSNSQLHSTRPAPPSPAPSRPGSRPGSQILSPGLLTGTTGTFPSSPSSSRDRAGSTSSSRGASTLGMGRRVSNSSASGRAVSKSRPKSALGASSFLPQGDGASDSETQTGASTPTHLNSSSALSGIVGGSGSSNAESSLVSESIPEHGVPVIQSRSPNIAPSSPMISEDHRSSASGKASPSVESKPKRQEVIIRDFAFPKTDPRFEGPGLPLSAPTPTEEPSSSSSRRNSRWGNFSLGDGSDNGTGASSGGFGRKLSGSGWSGFGMLSWKGLMGRSSRRPSQSIDDHAIGDDDDDDYPINIAPDHDEDDYAFSDSETPSTTSQQGDSHQHLFQISGVDSEADEGEEPFGVYRAMYPFDAVGEHEIGLEEGDLLEVRGRGGGQGWVVAVRRTLDPEGKLVRLRKNSEGESEEKEGLVPESYLERVDSLSATEEGRPTSTASASPLTNPTTAGGTTSHSSSGVLDVIPESTSTNQLEPLSGGFKTSGQTTQAEPIAQKTDEPERMSSSEEAGFEKEAAT